MKCTRFVLVMCLAAVLGLSWSGNAVRATDVIVELPAEESVESAQAAQDSDRDESVQDSTADQTGSAERATSGDENYGENYGYEGYGYGDGNESGASPRVIEPAPATSTDENASEDAWHVDPPAVERDDEAARIEDAKLEEAATNADEVRGEDEATTDNSVPNVDAPPAPEQDEAGSANTEPANTWSSDEAYEGYEGYESNAPQAEPKAELDGSLDDSQFENSSVATPVEAAPVVRTLVLKGITLKIESTSELTDEQLMIVLQDAVEAVRVQMEEQLD